MLKRTGIQAVLCTIVVVASTSVGSAQTPPNEDELPTGDVWISHAESVFVPTDAPGTAGEVPLANAPLPADIAPDVKNTAPLRLKLDITLTIQSAGMHHRLSDRASRSSCPRHSV